MLIALFPYLVAPVIAAMIWNQIYARIIPSLADIYGLSFLQISPLARPETALVAVTVVDLWMLIPFSTMLFWSALQTIPRELIDEAAVAGANSVQVFRYVSWPFLVPTMGLLTTIIVAYSLAHIDTIMALTGGGPGRATETVFFVIYKNSTADQRHGYGLAEAVVVSCVSVMIFVALRRLTNSSNVTELR